MHPEPAHRVDERPLDVWERLEVAAEREQDALVAQGHAPGGEGDGRGGDGARDLLRGEAVALERSRLEQHLDLAAQGPAHAHVGDAVDPPQPRGEHVFGVALRLEQIGCRGDERDVEDRLVGGVELLDHGRARVLGERAFDGVDALLDVDGGLVDADAKVELGDHHRQAFAADRGDAADPRQGGEAVFDRGADLLRRLLAPGAWVAGADGDDGDFEVGEQIDAEPEARADAEKDQRQEDGEGEDVALDEEAHQPNHRPPRCACRRADPRGAGG